MAYLHLAVHYRRPACPVSLSDIQEHYDSFHGLVDYKVDFLGRDHDLVSRWLALPESADCELVDDAVQYKEFDPVRFWFKTSGEIVVADDLRDYFEDIKPYPDINLKAGRRNELLQYGAMGLVHGASAGSASVFLSDDRMSVEVGSQSVHPEVGMVHSGVWAYSIADRADVGVPDDALVISVRPGTWEVIHRYGVSARSSGIEASLHWVAESQEGFVNQSSPWQFSATDHDLVADLSPKAAEFEIKIMDGVVSPGELDEYERLNVEIEDRILQEFQPRSCNA